MAGLILIQNTLTKLRTVNNPKWYTLRKNALEVLKSENKLQQIVRLIGPDALPDSERLVLVTAEMIKNGFLQQSAFDDVDKYCSSEKQIIILDLMMQFYERARAVLNNGAPLPQVVALPVREEIIRIKTTYSNEEVDKIQTVKDHLDSQMGELERMFVKAGI